MGPAVVLWRASVLRLDEPFEPGGEDDWNSALLWISGWRRRACRNRLRCGKDPHGTMPNCWRMQALHLTAMAPAPDRAEPAVARLGHVALRVADMERAKAFYTALGLQLTWDAADWAYLQSPLTGDGIALLSPDYTAAGPHFAFHLDDRAAVDAVHARLSASGVSVGPVHDHRDGTASFYLQDPEGNWLEILYEPPAGIPANTGCDPIPSLSPGDGGHRRETDPG